MFGNDEGDQLTTIQKQDYAEPKSFGSGLPKMDHSLIRASHFSLGDQSQTPLNPYETTYGSSMNPKQLPIKLPKENISFKSSININGEGPVEFQTESRAK